MDKDELGQEGELGQLGQTRATRANYAEQYLFRESKNISDVLYRL